MPVLLLILTLRNTLLLNSFGRARKPRACAVLHYGDCIVIQSINLPMKPKTELKLNLNHSIDACVVLSWTVVRANVSLVSPVAKRHL